MSSPGDESLRLVQNPGNHHNPCSSNRPYGFKVHGSRYKTRESPIELCTDTQIPTYPSACRLSPMDSGSSQVFIWHKQVSCANGCHMCQRLPTIHIFIAAFILIFSQACTLKQQSLPYNTIPQPASLTAKERSYGRWLYHKTCDRYPVDVSSAMSARLRSVSDELTRAAGFKRLYWHVHLFSAPEIIDIRAAGRKSTGL